MLKCHLDVNNDIASVNVEGNLLTILADVTFLVREIYMNLSTDDAQEAFKHLLQRCIAEDSPVWEKTTKKDGITSVFIKLPKDFRPDAEEEA